MKKEKGKNVISVLLIVLFGLIIANVIIEKFNDSTTQEPSEETEEFEIVLKTPGGEEYCTLNVKPGMTWEEICNYNGNIYLKVDDEGKFVFTTCAQRYYLAKSPDGYNFVEANEIFDSGLTYCLISAG